MASSLPYEVFWEEYKEALLWIESCVGIPASSRLRTYSKDLETIVKFKNDGIERIYGVEVKDLDNSCHEAEEIIRIHQNLSRFSGPGLNKRLKDLGLGPKLYSDETPNSALSRNIQYELHVAAELASAGLDLTLEHETADIVFRFNNQTFFVECKRPFSHNSLVKLLKEAQKQLQERYEKCDLREQPMGLIAICADRILNPDYSVMFATSSGQIDDALNQMLDLTVGDTSEETNRHLDRDYRTLGVIYSVALPTMIEPLGLQTYSTNRFVQHNQPDEQTSRLNILNQILEVIRKGISSDFERRYQPI